jgi:hypothetical protein
MSQLDLLTKLQAQAEAKMSKRGSANSVNSQANSTTSTGGNRSRGDSGGTMQDVRNTNRFDPQTGEPLNSSNNSNNNNAAPPMARYSSFDPQTGQELNSANSRPPLGYGPRRTTVGARDDARTGSGSFEEQKRGSFDSNLPATTTTNNNNLGGWDAPAGPALSSSWAMPPASDSSSSKNIFGGGLGSGLSSGSLGSGSLGSLLGGGLGSGLGGGLGGGLSGSLFGASPQSGMNSNGLQGELNATADDSLLNSSFDLDSVITNLVGAVEDNGGMQLSPVTSPNRTGGGTNEDQEMEERFRQLREGGGFFDGSDFGNAGNDSF